MTEIGVKRGEVRLCDHDEAWRRIAAEAIGKLNEILGNIVIDVQHVGSTAICGIKAKPIIDIAVAVNNLDDILKYEVELRSEGFYYIPSASDNTQRLFASGSYYEGTGELQTHFVHVVIADSPEWKDYISFRDYMNKHENYAKQYERLKLTLAHNNRELYTKGKHDFIQTVLCTYKQVNNE